MKRTVKRRKHVRKTRKGKKTVVRAHKVRVKKKMRTLAPRWKEAKYLNSGLKRFADLVVDDKEVSEFESYLDEKGNIYSRLPHSPGGHTYLVARKGDNELLAKQTKKYGRVIRRVMKGKLPSLPQQKLASTFNTAGRLYGYPPSAIRSFVENRNRPSAHSQLQKSFDKGIPEDDLALLEFVPGDDLEETKKAIADRKMALKRKRSIWRLADSSGRILRKDGLMGNRPSGDDAMAFSSPSEALDWITRKGGRRPDESGLRPVR